MSERTGSRFNWWLPLYGLLGAAIVLLPKMVLGNDIGTFLATALVAVIVGIILFVIVRIRAGIPYSRIAASHTALTWLKSIRETIWQRIR